MERYTMMQQHQYTCDANNWSIDRRDPVVGSFDAHNNWEDYETYLFKDAPTNTRELRALDFACGPGRNLVKFAHKFGRYDGVDIVQNNLDNAKTWLAHNNMDPNSSTLYLCNGRDLANIPSDLYDVITSTIALQHICVHAIRLSYFHEFFRVLRPGGMITLQMGFGPSHPSSCAYHDNYYDAHGTNGLCDTRVESPAQLEDDLKSVGFTDFKFYIRPTGPGDRHDNWIFFNARKPDTHTPSAL